MSGQTGAVTWRAGVIAAGWGERLRATGPTPKPLVRVGGRPLIDHVLRSLAEASPSDVVIIVNEQTAPEVRAYVDGQPWPFPVRWIVETTPSSMHSFLRVVETLAADGREGPFLVSTVDTIVAPGAFAAFAAACVPGNADLTLAVRAPGDDEKPLLVRLAADGTTVDALGASVLRPVPGDAWRDQIFETAGYYAVRASVLRAADAAREAGVPALRAFFERLRSEGFRVAAVPVPGGVDVDRAGDVRAAESFLQGTSA